MEDSTCCYAAEVERHEATSKLLSLLDMGFDIQEAENALQSGNGDLETAISMLASSRLEAHHGPTIVRAEPGLPLSAKLAIPLGAQQLSQDQGGEEYDPFLIPDDPEDCIVSPPQSHPTSSRNSPKSISEEW